MLSSRKRLEFFPSPKVDLIIAPWGFGGTDNLAQEGAHNLIENDLIRKLEAVGVELNQIEPPSLGPFQIQEESERIRNLEAIIQVNSWLRQAVADSIKQNHLPIVLGGDASLSIASSSAVASTIPDAGILWVNNHLANSSPKVTKSWNANRMAYTAISTDKDLSELHPDFATLITSHSKTLPIIDSKNIVLFGVSHKSAREETDQQYFSIEDIDELGLVETINSALETLEHCSKIHVIIDVNALAVSGVSNYSPGQLNYREALLLARKLDTRLRRQGRLASIDIVEHCPSREAWDKHGETSRWLNDLLANVFGETIFNALRKY